MKSPKILLLIISMLFYAVACEKGNTTPNDDNSPPDLPENPETSEAIDILYIGASYFVDIPALVKNFSNSTNKNTQYSSSIVPGRLLDFHTTYESTQNYINRKNWDYVILQGVGINVAYPEPPDYYTWEYPELLPALKTIHEQIKSNYSETKVIFCMPWAFEDGMTWVQGGTDTYFDMQQKIYDNTLALIDSVDVLIAPIGWAFNKIMQEDPPLHYLFASDYNHLSFKGKYLMASVLHSVIHQENPENIDYYIGIDEEEANHFHAIANDVVFTDFELWNIPPLDD